MKYLPLVEFAYNNNYQASIGMASYEALNGRKCRTQYVGMKWAKMNSVKLVEVSSEKIRVI